eukprot:1140566-Pelagomonas_calceolata.AAC.4
MGCHAPAIDLLQPSRRAAAGSQQARNVTENRKSNLWFGSTRNWLVMGFSGELEQVIRARQQTHQESVGGSLPGELVQVFVGQRLGLLSQGALQAATELLAVPAAQEAPT